MTIALVSAAVVAFVFSGVGIGLAVLLGYGIGRHTSFDLIKWLEEGQ